MCDPPRSYLPPAPRCLIINKKNCLTFHLHSPTKVIFGTFHNFQEKKSHKFRRRGGHQRRRGGRGGDPIGDLFRGVSAACSLFVIIDNYDFLQQIQSKVVIFVTNMIKRNDFFATNMIKIIIFETNMIRANDFCNKYD